MRKIWNLLSHNSKQLTEFAIPISKFRFNAFRSYCGLSRFNNQIPPGPLVQYKNLVDQGKLQHDPYQESVASELEKLLVRLKEYEREMEEYHVNLSKWEENRENERRKMLIEEVDIYGNVGTWHWYYLLLFFFCVNYLFP